VVSLILLVYKF